MKKTVLFLVLLTVLISCEKENINTSEYCWEFTTKQESIFPNKELNQTTTIVRVICNLTEFQANEFCKEGTYFKLYDSDPMFIYSIESVTTKKRK